MSKNEEKYVGGNIDSMEIPKYLKDPVEWGEKVWKFLQNLKAKSGMFKKSGNYDTILKNLGKNLEKITKAPPSTGLWAMNHSVFNGGVFSKALKEYCKKGKDQSRVKKVEELRVYYKKYVEKEIASLITANNKSMMNGTDNRNFDGLKVLVFRGKEWTIIPPKGDVNDKRFQNLESLKKLVLGPEVQKICKNGFVNCKNLETIEVEGEGKAIELEKGAFEDCKKVTKVKGDDNRTGDLCKTLSAIIKQSASSASLSAPSKSKSARKSRNGKS